MRLTSWLFTKRGGVEFGTTEDKSIQWQGAGFELGTSGLQVQRPNLPHFVFVFPSIQYIKRSCYLTHSNSRDYLVIYKEENPMQCLGVQNLCQSTKLLRQWFKRQKWRI